MTFLISVLTGLGVGSGGLYILYLTFIKNIPQAEAQGMNLAFFITATFAAAVINTAKGRVSFASLFYVMPTGILGAYLGCRTAAVTDGRVLSVLFGIMLAVVGIAGFVKLTKKN